MSTIIPVQDSATGLKIANPIVKTVLRSPLHRLMGSNFMLLTFTGRKTGKQYSTPTACLRDGDAIYFATGSNWWKNLQGGAPVQMIVGGEKMFGKAEAITDSQEVARLIQKFIARVGNKKAYLLGLKVEGSEPLTLEEIQRGVNTSRVIIRIEPQK